ncbi:hypothetical protein Tco_1456254 [Tanacetum coccineum]
MLVVCVGKCEARTERGEMYRTLRCENIQLALLECPFAALFAARDEKWIPSTERVKISSTNIRLETIVSQKEETFQVVIDIIKNSMYFKDFTISAYPTRSVLQYVEVILVQSLIYCPRVEGVDLTDVPDDDTALTFLVDLGYKGPLNRHTNMLKFIRKGENYQEYGLPIPDVMLTDAIKQSKPELAKKKTYGKRRVKKKVTMPADDNIISDDPDAALELAKSISQTEAEEAFFNNVFTIYFNNGQ